MTMIHFERPTSVTGEEPTPILMIFGMNPPTPPWGWPLWIACPEAFQPYDCRRASASYAKRVVAPNSVSIEPSVGSALRNQTVGYGSIPIHTIFRGMNIHFNPAILMWTTGVLLVLTHPYFLDWLVDPKAWLMRKMRNSSWLMIGWPLVNDWLAVSFIDAGYPLVN